MGPQVIFSTIAAIFCARGACYFVKLHSHAIYRTPINSQTLVISDPRHRRVARQTGRGVPRPAAPSVVDVRRVVLAAGEVLRGGERDGAEEERDAGDT